MATYTCNPVSEIVWQETTFIIQKAHVTFESLPDFLESAYNNIYHGIQKSGVRPLGPPCAIYYSINDNRQEAEVAAAVPVPELTPDIKDLARLSLPASEALVIPHYGAYESMKPEYRALEKYMEGKGLERQLTVEEYLSDPELENDPARWKTNIYFIVRHEGKNRNSGVPSVMHEYRSRLLKAQAGRQGFPFD